MRPVLPLIVLLAQAAPYLPPGLEGLELPEPIIVTGHRGPATPKAEPIEYYRRYCFEANRRAGHSALPTADRDWASLDEEMRARLDITDSRTPAFVLKDAVRGHLLFLKFEELPRANDVTESRCTLIVLGGSEHAALVERMSVLFRGPGTTRHVGQIDGYDEIPGWRQWLWTGMPARHSSNWRVVTAKGASRAAGTWVVVTDPNFYDSYDYIIGDLKTNEGATSSLSILTFAYLHRGQ